MSLSIYFIASVVTLISIFIFRALASHLNLVDRPAGHKQHQGLVPIVGGIAMYLGFVAGVYLLEDHWHNYFYLILGSGFLLFVGIIDDIYQLSAKIKLIAQLLAVLLMTTHGVVLHDLGDLFFHGNLVLNHFALPFTIFAAIGIINAINMLDGMDGLAGGVTLSILLMLAVLAFVNAASNQLIILLIMISVLIPFLYFNLDKKIFMGNGGSMFLGFTLVWFLISFSQGEDRIAPPITMLCIMALPLFDTWRVMYQRIKAGHSPFRSDRQHIHHIMLGLGLNSTQITLGIILITFLIGLTSIFFTYYTVAEGTLLIGFVLCFMIYLRLNKFWLKKASSTIRVKLPSSGEAVP